MFSSFLVQVSMPVTRPQKCIATIIMVIVVFVVVLLGKLNYNDRVYILYWSSGITKCKSRKGLLESMKVLERETGKKAGSINVIYVTRKIN